MGPNPRNLKRLVALTAAMLMTFAVAMALGAGALGAGFVLAGAAVGTCAWARPPGHASAENVYRSRNTAPSYRDTGQDITGQSDMGGRSSNYFMNSGVPPSGRVRKNRFTTSMTFRGDRICTVPQRDNAATARGAPAGNLLPFVSRTSSSTTTLFNSPCSTQSMVVMKASPTVSASSRIRKLIDFGLTHYRARDRGFAASLAA